MRLRRSVTSNTILVYLSLKIGDTLSAQLPRDQGSYSPAVIAASDFLRRGYQASIVVGNWIYVDGGTFSFTAGGSPQYFYSSTLLSIDLSQNWTNATVVFQSTPKPDGVPNLDGPSLWYDDKEDMLYSGFTGTNTSFGPPRDLPPLSLWAFKPDQAGSGVWNEIVNATSPVWNSLTRPIYPLQAHGSERAWVLGGNNLPYEMPTPIGENIVQFNMDTRTFGNSTVQCCNATKGIAAGAMQHVTSFGPQGLLIALGGVNGKMYGEAHDLVGFATVSVFDPAKQEWWNQTTTGSEPSPRIQFCTAGISSTNGTFEIFVYAGWDGNLGTRAIQYDTISILTLPAFHWITVPYNPQSPRHGHSCNAVGGSQIISIGGVDSNSKIEGGVDSDTIKGTFNSTPDPFAQGLAIFDMTTLSFVRQYTAKAPPYEQSEAVKQFYAQSQGDYLQHLSPGVAALLQTTHFSNINSTNTTSTSQPSFPKPYTSTSQPSSPKPYTKRNVGVIAGGVVGGAVVAFFIAVAAGIVILRKRDTFRWAKPRVASRIAEKPHQASHSVLELHGNARPIELCGLGLKELNEQSLQEMEQPKPHAELDGHESSATQVKNNCG